jgi:hypothetical protein
MAPATPEMTMCKQHLAMLYRIYVLATRIRIQFIENWLIELPVFIPLTEDESRNELELYQEMFSAECRVELEQCYRNAMTSIQAQPFGKSQDVIRALAFLQGIVARAMWRYNCEAGQTLETFARQYDRLDDDSEQRRLHAEAQAGAF